MKKDRVTLVPPGDKPDQTPTRVLVAGDAAYQRKFLDVFEGRLTALDKRAVETVESAQSDRELIEKLSKYEYDCIVIGRTIGSQNSIYILETLSSKYELCPPFILFDDNLDTKEIVKAFRVGFGDCVVSSDGRGSELNRAIKRVVEKYRKAQLVHDEIEYLSKLATHDRLTGLPNRAYLDERLDQLDESAVRHQSQFAILLIDISNFSQINDTYGHAIGDEALRAFARRLAQHARKSDSFGRYDGDKFLYLVDRDISYDAVDLACSRLSSALTLDVRIDDINLSLSASIGAAYFPVHGGNSEQVLAAAGKAMAHAKSNGGGYSIHRAGEARNSSVGPSEQPVSSSPIGSPVDFHADKSGRAETGTPDLSAPNPAVSDGDGSDRAAGQSDQRADNAQLANTVEENRRVARRFRVLKRGQIIIGNGISTIDCVVRDLSEHGARVSVDDPIMLPESFSFMLVEDGVVYPAFKRWQQGKSIGIEFSEVAPKSTLKIFSAGR